MSKKKMFDQTFWTSPPWAGGSKKYRLGLKPIPKNEWFSLPLDEKLLQHKTELLNNDYHSVVQTIDESQAAQQILLDHIKPKKNTYPDLIANMSLEVADDLCVIEASGKQRLIAASICSPSYWNLKTKIGKSLRDIHKPVTTLNEKIGSPIEKFIENAPLHQPFKRENWFIHSDDKRFHTKPESLLRFDVESCFVRSERETLCKYHEKYTLFTINVRFQPLAAIKDFDSARKSLLDVIMSLDNEEMRYFGGERKVHILTKYLNSLS